MILVDFSSIIHRKVATASYEAKPSISKGKYKTFAVDCDSEEGKELIKKSKNFPYVIGDEKWQWPTIMIFFNNHPCAFYTGTRSAEALRDFLNVIRKEDCDIKIVSNEH